MFTPALLTARPRQGRYVHKTSQWETEYVLPDSFLLSFDFRNIRSEIRVSVIGVQTAGLILHGGNWSLPLVPLKCFSRNLQFSHTGHRVLFIKEKMPWCPCPFKNEAYRPECKILINENTVKVMQIWFTEKCYIAGAVLLFLIYALFMTDTMILGLCLVLVDCFSLMFECHSSCLWC